MRGVAKARLCRKEDEIIDDWTIDDWTIDDCTIE